MDPNANMVCSPISALFPLGKLALGAEKETAKELLNAIGVTSKIKVCLTVIINYLTGAEKFSTNDCAACVGFLGSVTITYLRS